jgi:thioredoxin reductase (NADPH)
MNPVNLNTLEALIAQSKLRVLMPSSIQSIELRPDGRVQVVFEKEQPSQADDFDCVVYALGGMTPTGFLRNSGVELDDSDEPKVDPQSFESCVEGLYIVGDLLGKKQGGGSIIAGFNTASRAVSDLLKKHFNVDQAPAVVSLAHLKH